MTQDPDDDDLDIIKDGLEFAKDAVRDLEQEHNDTDWQYFTTGHSLGALMATALAVEQDGKVERCAHTSPITFQHCSYPTFSFAALSQRHGVS